MSENNIRIEVHCLKPEKVFNEKNKYRLYMNNDLLTERNWIWDTKTIIAENIWAELPPGDNVIKIQPILDPPNSEAQFALRHLTVNGNIVPDWGGERMELSFLL